MNEQQLKEAFMQYLQQKSGAQTQQEFEAYVQQLGEEGLQQEYMQFMQLLQQQQVASRKFGGMLNYIEKLRGICPEGYEMQFFKQGGQICKKCVQKARMQNGGDFPEDNPVKAFKKKYQLKAQIDKMTQPGKYDKFIPSKPKNVIEGSVRNGKSNFDPNNTTLPSRNADGMQTPNRLQRSGRGSNNILIPKKPIKQDKCGTKIEMDKCGKKMKKKACGGSVEKNQQGGSVTSMKQSGFFPRTTIFRTIQYPEEYEAGVPDTVYQKTVSYGLPFTTDIRSTGKVIHDRTGYFRYRGSSRTEPWTEKVSPSGRAVSGQYNQLRNEYNKMK